jgi:hypothetical protein
MKVGFKRDTADRAARTEAEVVIQRWNDQLALGGDICCVRAALLAGTPWLDVFRSGPSRAIDLRALDRHPLVSVGTLVRCGDSGRLHTSTPIPGSASLTADTIAAGGPTAPPSPMPLAPKEV